MQMDKRLYFVFATMMGTGYHGALAVLDIRDDMKMLTVKEARGPVSELHLPAEIVINEVLVVGSQLVLEGVRQRITCDLIAAFEDRQLAMECYQEKILYLRDSRWVQETDKVINFLAQLRDAEAVTHVAAV